MTKNSTDLSMITSDELKNILALYGVEVPEEELDSIKILNKNARRLSFLNKKSGEVTTSDLAGLINRKCDSVQTVSVSKHKSDSKITIEDFHKIEPVKTFLDAGKNALDSRRDDNNKVFSRVYAEVKTKYGEFTLVVEERYKNSEAEPYRHIALYHGNKENCFIPLTNDFDYSRYCLLRIKYSQEKDFSRWDFGYIDDKHDGPDRSIWSFNKNDNSNKIPVFGTSNMYGYDSWILQDGSVELGSVDREVITKLQGEDLEVFEQMDLTSKAYFGGLGYVIAILKHDNVITIKQLYVDNANDGCRIDTLGTIQSSSYGEFDSLDFLKIIEKVNSLSLDEGLKEFISTQIRVYLNMHKDKDLKKLENCSLKDVSYKEIVDYLETQNITLLVETLLKDSSKMFGISIEDLIGESPFGKAESEKPYVYMPNHN